MTPLLSRCIGKLKSSIALADSFVIAGRGIIGNVVTMSDGSYQRETPESRWFDRLRDRPKLEHLGFGLDGVATESYPRMPDLCRYLFDSQEWDPEEFVGFRCQVDYPLGGVQYLLTFDFTTDAVS